MIILIISILLLILLVIALCIGIKISKMTFFCAFPRTIAYGNPNKLVYIHLKGFFFIISNDLFGNDVIYSNEASNMMFQYNLKPTLNAEEVMNSKKVLNIEILDTVTNQTMSYTVQNSNKALAVKFFIKYKELMQLIHKK